MSTKRREPSEIRVIHLTKEPVAIDLYAAYNALILSAPYGSHVKMTEGSSNTCLLDILEQERPDNILVVYDQGAYHAGTYSPEQLLEPQLHAYLDRRGYHEDHLIKITGFHTYPTADYVRQVIAQIKAHGIDLVIGIGGGMAMDIAKTASILAAQSDDPEVYITGKAVPSPRCLRLMLIPTTAGTGAEVTQFSVVYIDKVKYSLSHPTLSSDYALLVPELTYALPKAVTATSGCDAIAQAIEAFWSVNATSESRKYSTQALVHLLPHIIEAVDRPTEENRRAMMLGACYAGLAINIAKTTWAHAASYWLTAHKHISHGHAVMLTLPYLFRLIDEADEHTLQKTEHLTVNILREQMTHLYNILGVQNGLEAKDQMFRIMDNCGLERQLDRLGVKPPEFEEIVDAVNPERMKNMPITISRESALDTLHQALRI